MQSLIEQAEQEATNRTGILQYMRIFPEDVDTKTIPEAALEYAKREGDFQLTKRLSEILSDGREYVVRAFPYSVEQTGDQWQRGMMEFRREMLVNLRHWEQAEIGETCEIEMADFTPRQFYAAMNGGVREFERCRRFSLIFWKRIK